MAPFVSVSPPAAMISTTSNGASTSETVVSNDLASFESFSGDLTSYLNSTDYMVAFLGDSLRQAWGLLDELRASARELKQFVQTLDPNDWSRDYGVRDEDDVVTVQNTVGGLIEDYFHHQTQIEDWARTAS